MRRVPGRDVAASGEPTEGIFSFGPFEFDSAPRLLYRGEEEILLPPRAAAVLEVFLRRPGEVLSKDELLEAVWKDAFVGEDSLTQALSIVRQALDDDAQNPTYIETKRKRGYRFVAEVNRLPRGQRIPGVAGAATAAVASSPGPVAPTPSSSPPGASTVPSSPPGVSTASSSATGGATVTRGGLEVGRRLGRYEIRGDLGAGAMGVVYRARDTVLERDVAIKLLPQAFVADGDRVACLEREAKLLASVSHPNVAHIYSLENVDGMRFPVLELIDGVTLEERLRTSRLSVKEALEISRQVAAGLEAAHECGIVHRDLKPANIKVTPKGEAKVLDFGLATSLVVRRYESRENDSPTESIAIGGSYRGAIVGTVAYMSPEQARGLETDKRADIWSFGCVLYEALTGRKAFDHQTVADTLGAIFEQDPNWSALPPSTPPMARSLVRRCLRKNPDRRLRDIADARLEIEEALEEPEHGSAGAAPASAAPAWWRRALPWSLAALATAVALWSFMPAPPSPTPRVSRLLLELQPGQHLTGGDPQESASWGFQRPGLTAIALSPDGQYLVYAAATDDSRQLYLRDMGRQQAAPIPGTEGGSGPFFSPDGEWIGFYASGALKRVPLSGGEPSTIVADTPTPFGASWAEDGVILFSAGELGGLLRVSEVGGVPEPLAPIGDDNGRTPRLPHALPGGRAALYTVMSDAGTENARIVVESFDTGERKVLVEGGTDARFASTGHLVFARRGTLMAAPFSLERLELTGEPVRIVEDVMHASGAASTTLDSGAAQYSFSAAGSFVYVAGGIYPEPARALVWVDREGGAQPLPQPRIGYSAPRLSPDGRQLAYVVGRRTRRDIWAYDILRETPRRLTFGESSGGSVWSPDGNRLAYSDDSAGGAFNLFSMAADGSGGPERLTESDNPQFASSWSSNGALAFVEGTHDIWVLSPEGDPEPHPFLETPFNEQWPVFSPDGRWLAYTSNETGQDEVYVRPYPGPDPAVRVSTDGGQSPAWARDGRELFYRSREGMMAVEVTAGPTFTHGRPRFLFDERSYLVANPTRAYDVAPDGRFVMVTRTEQEPTPATQIRVVLNWFEELKQRARAER